MNLVTLFARLIKPILKRKYLVAQELHGKNILTDVIQLLDADGWIHRRTNNADLRSLVSLAQGSIGTANAQSIATDIEDWIRSDHICDYDFKAHSYLCQNFPSSEEHPRVYSEPAPNTTYTPGEGGEVGGEDVEEDLGVDLDADQKEPTEAQKRELFKMTL